MLFFKSLLVLTRNQSSSLLLHLLKKYATRVRVWLIFNFFQFKRVVNQIIQGFKWIFAKLRNYFF